MRAANDLMILGATLVAAGGCFQSPAQRPSSVSGEPEDPRADQVVAHSGSATPSESSNDTTQTSKLVDGGPKAGEPEAGSARGVLSNSGPPAGSLEAIWLDWLETESRLFLADEEVQRSFKEFVRATACTMFAVQGRVESARELAKLDANSDERSSAYMQIAAAQSQANDVEGAFRTAELIGHYSLHEQAKMLIVAKERKTVPKPASR